MHWIGECVQSWCVLADLAGRHTRLAAPIYGSSDRKLSAGRRVTTATRWGGYLRVLLSEGYGYGYGGFQGDSHTIL